MSDEPEYHQALANAERLEAEIERLEAELRVRRAAEAAACGLLMIDMPEPGTDMAKVMAANAMLRQERDRVQEMRRREHEHLSEFLVALVGLLIRNVRRGSTAPAASTPRGAPRDPHRRGGVDG